MCGAGLLRAPGTGTYQLDADWSPSRLHIVIPGPKQTSAAAAPSRKRAAAGATSRTAKDDNYDLADYITAEDLAKRAKRDADTAEADAEPEPVLKSHSERQPSLVTGGQLREYQLAGVEWLVSLFENGLNGILADEMGLGKTLQCIAFLAYLRERGVLGPFLIVAPLSTVANWVNEFRRYARGGPPPHAGGGKVFGLRLTPARP